MCNTNILLLLNPALEYAFRKVQENQERFESNKTRLNHGDGIRGGWVRQKLRGNRI
jgi:hypothetical protein